MNNIESILLQGYLQYSATNWGSQSIITQGFFITTIPASSIPISIFDIIYTPSKNIGDKYPRWMDYYYNTSETTGSLLRRFFISYSQTLAEYSYFKNKVVRRALWDPWLGELSHGWTTTSQAEVKDITSIVVYNNEFTTIPRKCPTFNHFIGSIGPSYVVTDEGSIYFKDLDQATLSVEVSGVISVGSDLMKGRDVYWTEDYTNWNIIQSNDSSINYTTGTIAIPATGNIGIIYSSQIVFNSHRDSVVYINNGSAIPLYGFDYWNSIDELGLIFDISRIPEEDNSSYFNRIKACGMAIGDKTKQGLLRTISRHLLGINLGYWDGVSTINIPTSSLVSNLWIKDQKQSQFISHDILKPYNGYYVPAFSEWSDIYIFNDSYVVNTYSTSGGKIFFDSISDNVEASYKYDYFSLVSSGDFITQLSPTNNTKYHVYFLSWISSGGVYTMNSQEYKTKRLLLGDGSPTTDFVDLASKLKSYSMYNYTNWGSDFWYSENNILPQVDYLPLVMD